MSRFIITSITVLDNADGKYHEVVKSPIHIHAHGKLTLEFEEELDGTELKFKENAG